jgi:hypothetical protein
MRTGPSSEDNTIFDLLEGADVVVKQVQPNWVLVSAPSGVAGWVPAQDLFQHSGKKNLW